MKQIKKQSHAFSLIEVLFAIVCFSMLIIPLYSLFSQGNYGTVQVRHEVLAQQHASNLLSYLYLFPYDHPHLAPCEDKDFEHLNLEMGVESLALELDKPYSRKLGIQEFSSADWPVRYKVITVTLSWQALSEARRELKMCGLVFK